MLNAETAQQSSGKKSVRSFDSLAFAKRLQAGGAFTREQAETLAEENAALIDDRLATKDDIEALRLATKTDIEALRLATKTDIEALRLATKTDIEALRLSTRTDLEHTKAEILKWMFGQTLVIIAAVIGIMRVGH